MVHSILEKEQKNSDQLLKEPNKRYFPRWEVNKRVEFSGTGGAAFQSLTKDLSLDGALILVLGNPPPQNRIKLIIHLTNKDNFEVQGRIVWSKTEPTHKLFGVVFENLSKKANKLLMRHAFEPSEDQLLTYGLFNYLVLKGCFSSKRTLRLPGVTSLAAVRANGVAERRAAPRYLLSELPSSTRIKFYKSRPTRR